jgi:two-component system NtrC family sensor kinase
MTNEQPSGIGADYSRLTRRFILIALVCSVVPLLLVGWGISRHYSQIARTRMQADFRERTSQHKKTIELFLSERTAAIQLLAQTHSLGYLSDPKRLSRALAVLNREYRNAFTDLGLIDGSGKHLAYVGPYDLMDKNYAQAFWFEQVMSKGSFVSDMFLGFRRVPHVIIAVSRIVQGRKWILRATLNTQVFRSLVEGVRIGRTGEVYLLNSQGVLQTQPRFEGRIMEKAPLRVGPYHHGIKVRVVDTRSKGRLIVAQTWLQHVRWALVVRQSYDEAFADVNQANRSSLLFLLLSAVAILLVSVFTARTMIKSIKKRDLEKDRLSHQLMQAGKMASIGELAAGVAHEVNNPLAIIMTERQILLDLAGRVPDMDAGFRTQLEKSLSQIHTQCKRCKHTTQNLLRFSRRTKAIVEEVDLNAFLMEVVDLLEREAYSSGVKFFTDLQEGLPPILSDPSLLQQVFLNIMTNGVDAHEGKPYGRIQVSTSSDEAAANVVVVVEDSGWGIRPEHIDKIFDPFFTTKPTGKGTGLGLSICYGIVKKLGGEIGVESVAGEGTVFTVVLPVSPPSDYGNAFNIGRQTPEENASIQQEELA